MFTIHSNISTQICKAHNDCSLAAFFLGLGATPGLLQSLPHFRPLPSSFGVKEEGN